MWEKRYKVVFVFFRVVIKSIMISKKSPHKLKWDVVTGWYESKIPITRMHKLDQSLQYTLWCGRVGGYLLYNVLYHRVAQIADKFHQTWVCIFQFSLCYRTPTANDTLSQIKANSHNHDMAKCLSGNKENTTMSSSTICSSTLSVPDAKSVMLGIKIP